MTKQQLKGMSIIFVSPHFSLAEVLTTSRPDLQTGLLDEELTNVQIMASYMEKVRDLLQRPIKVNSWFRSPALNKAVGGVHTSAHLKGLAVDFPVSSAEFRRVAQAVSIYYDQAIFYESQSFMHLGLRKDDKGFPQQRRQIIYKK